MNDLLLGHLLLLLILMIALSSTGILAPCFFFGVFRRGEKRSNQATTRMSLLRDVTQSLGSHYWSSFVLMDFLNSYY
jgi:hypothetical protein